MGSRLTTLPTTDIPPRPESSVSLALYQQYYADAMSKPQSIVVVTGAGASHDLSTGPDNYQLKFPLGKDFPREIVARNDAIVQCFMDTRRETMESPDPPQELAEYLRCLVAQLRTGVYDTVDEFVGRHAGTSPAIMAAFACAYVVSEAEYKYVVGTRSLHGWIKPLAKLWAESSCSQSASDSPGPKIKFVTFNYDRTIEWALAHAHFGRHGGTLEAALATDYGGCVAHVHGRTFLDHNRCYKGEAMSSVFDQIQRSAQSIRLVHASNGRHNRDYDAAEAKRAIDWLRGADVIAFLGFGFAKSCLDAIGISPSNPLEKWSSANTVVTSWHDTEDNLISLTEKFCKKLELPKKKCSDGGRDFWSCVDAVNTAIDAAQQAST